MQFFVYILRSSKDSSLYIGYTSDLEKRLEFHNSGKSVYTSRKIPWEIVYTEKFSSKTDAIIREKFLKKQRNREFYNKLINEFRSRSSAG